MGCGARCLLPVGEIGTSEDVDSLEDPRDGGGDGDGIATSVTLLLPPPVSDKNRGLFGIWR